MKAVLGEVCVRRSISTCRG